MFTQPFSLFIIAFHLDIWLSRLSSSRHNKNLYFQYYYFFQYIFPIYNLSNNRLSNPKIHQNDDKSSQLATLLSTHSHSSVTASVDERTKMNERSTNKQKWNSNRQSERLGLRGSGEGLEWEGGHGNVCIFVY